jgi:hypothetical protein
MAGITESFFVDGQGENGSAHIGVDRAGVDRRVASADVSAAGRVTDRIEGRAPTRDHSELRAAQGLVERLNQDGASWQSPELVHAHAHTERGVDCIARNSSGQALQIQVTTTEREVWQRTRENLHERAAEIHEVVEAIHDAIQAKSKQADPKIMLALDATDSPRAAVRPVVNAFRTQYGAWAAGVGFQEIWVVGPVVALVTRLDGQN